MRNDENKLLLSQLVNIYFKELKRHQIQMLRRYSIALLGYREYSLDIVLCSSHPRTCLFIYTGRRKIEKFEFVLTRRLPVTATLFCPEFVLLVF